jgi:hypothetical protein
VPDTGIAGPFFTELGLREKGFEPIFGLVAGDVYMIPFECVGSDYFH